LGGGTRSQGRYGKRGAPGAVDTAMLKAATPRMGGEEAVKGMVARTPLGYWASARHYWRIGPLN